MIRVALYVIFFLGPISTSFATQWTQLADFGGEGRHRASGVVLGNKAYVGCGHINGTGTETFFDDWWEYDPATNSWTQKANIPWVVDSANWLFSNFLDCSIVELGGDAYLAKGYWSPFYKYSPTSNSWTQLDTIGIFSSMTHWSKPLNINETGYFFSKEDEKIGIYNPATDQWTDHPNFSLPIVPGASSNNNDGWTNVISMNGIMYFHKYNVQDTLFEFWSFDVINSEWTDLGEWIPPWGGEIIFEHQGIIIVACGGVFQATDKVYAYDPINGNWGQLEDFPGAKRRYGVGFTINGTGYMTTGTNGVNLSDLWRMNNILNIEGLQNDAEISVFPNPASEFVNIKLLKTGRFSFSLYSQNGQLVRSGESFSGNAKINREGLLDGVYTLYISPVGINPISKRIIFE